MGQASWPKSSRKGIGVYTPTTSLYVLFLIFFVYIIIVIFFGLRIRLIVWNLFLFLCNIYFHLFMHMS
jgi:hypothetical protein